MAKNTKETLGFQSEIKQLLKLVTHSLYSNREIFLRELISNASDAADKLRFEAVSHPELYENDSDLKITISFDKDARTLTISDNGIGMSRQELINNLGTIAKSGTREFIEHLTSKDQQNSALIGQFGVGFYSAFVVAEHVKVTSRKAGSKTAAIWESDGEGEFSIDSATKTTRGTDIELTLRSDNSDLLDYWKLKEIITKYSDHISLPIVLVKPAAEAKSKDPAEETVNRATALWTLPKSQVTDQQYQEFYKHLSHDFDDPLTWSHNKVEGKLEYTTLLFIPKHAPFNMWQPDQRHGGLKLYVQRVFIMDEAQQLLPNYLRFVKGVVDAKDLPLNVSREILQNNHIIAQIKAGVTKRVLDMLLSLAKEKPEEYAKFYQEFGLVLKEGMVEDPANQEKIAELLRFSSTKVDNETPSVTLSEYVNRMRPEQKKIYYLTAESYLNAKNSPYLEQFRRLDIEVLLLTDRIDEWWLSHFPRFQDKEFSLITQDNLDLKDLGASKDQDKDSTDQASDEFIKRFKEALADKVSEVKYSSRLVDSPVCLTTGANELSFNMHRMMSAFNQLGHNMPAIKPIIELNPHHPLIVKIKQLDNDSEFKNWAEFLLDEGLLLAGEKIADTNSFAQRINSLLVGATSGK